jgi:hypothetical protein
MTIDAERILEVERERVTVAFEAAGGFGLTADEKVARLGPLCAELRKLEARQELTLRQLEAEGKPVTRKDVNPELFLMLEADLQREAA